MIDLRLGDCIDVLKELGDNSIDAIVTDPPYGLSFMGKAWDKAVPSVDVWSECLRVLKPGGHLLSFAGTRTQHRMAVNIEDAGFEIRDMIAWVYGSGFPKSHNLKDEHDGWGTALKPALEPITLARKPFKATVAANVLEHGTGALNVDGCRVGVDGSDPNHRDTKPSKSGDCSMFKIGGVNYGQNSKGRWPANLIHDGSDEVVGLFPVTRARGNVSPTKRQNSKGAWAANGAAFGIGPDGPVDSGDQGSAARFFYCAKASKKDRGEDNKHPTVKPSDLMRYLCRLVTPPGGTVLDPFMGSGSTGKAAILEGFDFIGIELDPEYIEIARQRIKNAGANQQLKIPA